MVVSGLKFRQQMLSIHQCIDIKHSAFLPYLTSHPRLPISARYVPVIEHAQSALPEHVPSVVACLPAWLWLMTFHFPEVLLEMYSQY